MKNVVELRRPNSERQLTAGLTKQHHFRGVTRMAKSSIGELLFQACSTCGALKPAREFYQKRERYTTQCKSCLIKKTVDWSKANPERRAKNWRKWLTVNRELHNIQSKKSYKKHPEPRKAYVLRNPDKVRRTKREYAKRNLPKLSAQYHRRRALLRGNGGTHSSEDISALLIAQNRKCGNLSCLKRIPPYHVDHIVPLSKDGSNNPDNLQLLCPRCNLKKHDKSPQAWAKENGVLFA